MEKKLWDILLSLENIILITHSSPDGDTIGSGLAIYKALKNKGKKVYIYCPDKLPSELMFLPNAHKISNQIPSNYKNALFVDCARISRTRFPEAFDIKQFENIFNIDHHASNDNFGSINIVDTTRPSSGEVIFDFLHKNTLLDKDIATCVYTAVVADSNYFKNDRVDKKSFEIASKLCEYGISPTNIAMHLDRSWPLAKMRLLAKMLSRISLHKDGEIGFTYLVIEDFKESGADYSMMDGFANYPLSLNTVKIGIIAFQAENGIYKVSLRSKPPFECTSLASKFGGGGHLYASGYISEKNSPNEILEEIIQII